MAKSAWPKIVQWLRRGSLGVFEFASRQTCRECGEHHPSGFFYIDAGVAMNAVMNTHHSSCLIFSAKRGVLCLREIK
jgi:hypothetical protein